MDDDFNAHVNILSALNNGHFFSGCLMGKCVVNFCINDFRGSGDFTMALETLEHGANWNAFYKVF